ncbi:MAG: cyclic nucleotide-binding domain-containing protein [Thermodesulfobacteriota bacterium]
MAVLRCEACGFSKKVPDKFLGRKVRCPGCDKVASVEPDAQDLALDDVIPEPPAQPAPAPKPGAPAPDLSLAAETPPPRPRPNLLAGSLPRNLLAGLAGGVLAYVFSLTAASLVFSPGQLPVYLTHGLTMALFCAVAVGAASALRSELGFAMAGPEALTMAVLFLMTSSMAQDMAGMTASTVFATVTAGLVLTALFVGLGLVGAGAVGAGAAVRFIPFQAVGGVMAGLGFHLLAGAYSLCVGGAPCLDGLTRQLTDLAPCLEWLPALALGLVLFAAMRRSTNLLLLAGLLLAATAATHGILYWQGTSPEQAALAGWLYPVLPLDAYWELYSLDFLASVRLDVILDHSGYVAAAAGLTIAAKMLKASELELVLGRQVDLDREMEVLGLGNVISAALGGLPGALSLHRSLGARGLGAGGPLAGVAAAVICAAAIPFAGEAAAWVPRFVPAGLLAFMGLSLLVRWLVDTRTAFTRGEDYALLFLVFLLTVTLGFLLGMAVGVALAMMTLVGRYGSVSVVKHVLSGSAFRSNVDRAPSQFRTLKAKGGQIYIMRLQGFIFLGATGAVLNLIRARQAAEGKLPLRYLILDFSHIAGLDSSVAMAFARLKQTAREQEFTLVFSGVPFELDRQLADAGLLLDDPEGGSRGFVSLDYAMEWCENHILEAENVLRLGKSELPDLLAPVFPEPRLIPLLMRVMKKVEVEKGKPVFRQGDVSDAMYFIEYGMVTVQLELEGNRVLRLKKMGPGTVFGEMGIYTSAPRSASIVAAEDCTLYRLSKTVLDALQTKNPHLVSAIHRFIVGLLSERVADANDKIRDLQA